jgi:hypothetical protein
MRLRIKQARPINLNDAIRHAVELEAFNKAELKRNEGGAWGFVRCDRCSICLTLIIIISTFLPTPVLALPSSFRAEHANIKSVTAGHIDSEWGISKSSRQNHH